MLMAETRVAVDFVGTTDFVITDPTFELSGNTALLIGDFRGCRIC